MDPKKDWIQLTKWHPWEVWTPKNLPSCLAQDLRRPELWKLDVFGVPSVCENPKKMWGGVLDFQTHGFFLSFLFILHLAKLQNSPKLVWPHPGAFFSKSVIESHSYVSDKALATVTWITWMTRVGHRWYDDSNWWSWHFADWTIVNPPEN